MTASETDEIRVVYAPEIQALYPRLLEIRASKTISLKDTPLLRKEVMGPDKKLSPFRPRYYQSQGIAHMMLMKRLILGDGTGLGKCERLDTLILSSTGLRPMGSFLSKGFDHIKAEEGFYDMEEHVEVWTGQRMAKVSRFYWSGKKPTLKVTTRNGYQIEGTLVHPLRTRSSQGERWVTLQELQEGDFLCVDRSEVPFPAEDPAITFEPSGLHVNTKSYSYPSSLTPDLATLLGYIVGEGNRTPFGVVVTQHKALNPEPHQEIRDLFFRVFGWDGNQADLLRDTRISVSSVGIKKYLAACGVGEELSRDKFVPPCILQGSASSVRGFLSALIESEGSVAEGGVEFCSASEKLARQVQLLLLRFSIVSTLSAKHIKDNPHTYWRLTFFGDDAHQFQMAVGFRSKRKADALRESLTQTSNPNKDLIPHTEEQVKALKSLVLEATSREGSNDNRKGTGLKQFGESFQSTLKHIISGARNPSYSWLSKFLGIAYQLGLSTTPEYEEVLSLVRAHHFYDPIVKIETSEAEVMDIEVEDPAHCYVANGLLSHNTVQALAALCHCWGKEPDNKVIVVAPKAAIRQWESETERFTEGIKVFVVSGSAAEREEIYQTWASYGGPEKVILILNYSILVRDWDSGGGMQPDPKNAKKKVYVKGLLNKITDSVKSLVVIFDEATAFKNTSTKTFDVCQMLSAKSKRCYGLTATLLKNNLMEGYSIFRVVVPNVFSTKTKFMDTYAVVRQMPIKGGRMIPLVVGYKNLNLFRKVIDPYFLGRSKHMVSDELPTLITKEVICEMSSVEDRKYSEALSGILELGDGTIKEYEESKALVALIYCQQVVNSLSMLKFQGGDEILTGLFQDEVVKVEGMGAKEAALVELLTGELEGDKVIVYTRFESLVGRLQMLLKDEKIKSTRITGKESGDQRKINQDAFQDADSDTKVIFITDAGSEAINLQTASALIFFDAPWSWGNYVQTLGRPVRIGSVHNHVTVYHLIAERPRDKAKDRKTIDHHVLDSLRGKKRLSDAVLGEAAVGALTFDKEKSGTKELVRRLQGKVGVEDKADAGTV